MIGDGINRREGPLKVSGRARYSAERATEVPPLHGYILGAGIGRGRIARIDTARAEQAPGVRLCWTHHNAPQQSPYEPRPDLLGPQPQLIDDEVRYWGMPVAFVVAETFEQARAAAALIEVEYERWDGAFDLAAVAADAEFERGSRAGDIDKAMAEGAVSVDETYTTPYHFSSPTELPSCIAGWRDGRLTVLLAAQIISQLADGLATTLRLDRAKVVVDSAYVGGGFGSKIGLHCEAVLASLATMALGEPVKVVMTRRQVFSLVGHRPASISHIRLAATRDGKLTALGHDAVAQTSEQDDWEEGVANVARSLYAAPNRLTRNAYARVEVGKAEPVRGPGEMPGLLAFEVAMDELAEKLGMDPVELRLNNDTHIDPEEHRPLSGRRLAECLREGAERFGWRERSAAPRSRRDGGWLIGFGVAASIRGHFQSEAEALVRLEPEGRVLVRSDMTDPGTGTYTVVAQVAGEALGVPVEQVKVELARTDYPRGWGSGGSWGAANTTVAVDRACAELNQRIRAVAGTGYNDIFAEVRRHFPQGLEAVGRTLKSKHDPNYQDYSQFTYGASFAEVGVDAWSGEIRLRRMLGVFSAGRILNAKTARSQLIGGMIWGVSAALHEAAHVDPRSGAWVNSDFAEYLIPTHADIPAIEAHMLEDFDEHANHLGVKGIGELGAGGTGASVANAVYNATGVRVRDFPITLEKLIEGGLPAPE
jgi:xanthine dehydrogenase YagR molybdenum-binding subunit